MKRPTAVAMHVFGGGMLIGAAEHFDVQADFETFDLGLRTVKRNYPAVRMHHQESQDPLNWKNLECYVGVDVLFGNPRCTGFSNFNANNGDDKFGSCANQTRDIRQIVQATSIIAPKYCVIESVQGFLKAGKDLLAEIIELTRHRYRHALMLHNVQTSGVPQDRERVFLVMYPRHAIFNEPRPEMPKSYPTFRQACHDLLGEEFRDAPIDTTDDDEYIHGSGLHNWVRQHLPDTDNHAGMYECLKQGMSIPKVPTDALPEFWRHKRLMGRGASFHSAVRLCFDRPAHTIYASPKYLHPVFHRPITVREAARLMGVPDRYVYCGRNLLAQVGNGVCPPVASHVARMVVGSIAQETVGSEFADYDCPTGKDYENAEGKQLKIFEYSDYIAKIEPVSKFWEREGIEIEREGRHRLGFH